MKSFAAILAEDGLERALPMLNETAKAFVADESGATAIEYGLIAAGIFLAIVPPMAVMSSNIDATYQQILQYFTDIRN